MNLSRSNLSRLIALGVIAVLAPILALSEQSIKAIYDRWFNACTIVFDRDLVNKNNKVFYKVRLFVRGSGPDELPLTFEMYESEAKICKVSLDRDTEGRNLSFHPQSVQTCPGTLCEEKVKPSCDCGAPEEAPMREAKILIKPFHNAFDYSFTIHMGGISSLKEDNLKVYSVYPESKNSEHLQDRSVCRLEERGLFNILVWLNDVWRWAILTGMIVVLTILVGILRGKGSTG